MCFVDLMIDDSVWTKEHWITFKLDAMAEELIETGIMENAQQDANGIWKSNIDTTQIFSCDETP